MRDPLHVQRALAEFRNGRPAPDFKDAFLIGRDAFTTLVCWVRGCDFSHGAGQFCARCRRFYP